MPPDPFTHPDVDNDPLGTSQTTERVEWGLPSDEGDPQRGDHAVLPPAGFDYSGGMLVGHGEEATAQPPSQHPHLIRARSDAPMIGDLPHEATHRRFEPPRLVGIAQSGIGTLMFAQPNIGLHYVKLLALNVSLAAAGTIQFVQGSPDGLQVAAMGNQGPQPAGAQNLLAGTPLILPPADLANPWLWTAPDQALGLITVGAGAFANGWAIIAYSPYDS